MYCVFISLFSCSAHSSRNPPYRQVQGADRLRIIVHGTRRPIYQHNGTTYFEGKPQERYAIQIYNPNPTRTEAVVCVDGRDVINGKPCNLTNRGYVMEPWGSIEIEGFRISLDEVAAFRFSKVTDSYAYRMGNPFSIGNINVAFFSEKTYRVKPQPIPFKQKPHPPRRGHQPLEQLDGLHAADTGNLGTRFGERRLSRATETSFVRRHWSIPDQNLSYWYDDRTGLCNRGLVQFCNSIPLPPIQPSHREFAPPPPGWEHFYTTD